MAAMRLTTALALAAIAALAGLGLGPAPAQAPAAAPPALTVDGDVATPLALSLDDLAAMERVAVEIADKEGRRQSFSGVDAALVLAKAGAPIRESLKSTDAARYVHAQGSDGYVAVFATAEFDKGRFLIVDRIDGAPLLVRSGPLQLVAVSDDRRTRWVKQLKLLQVRASRP